MRASFLIPFLLACTQAHDDTVVMQDLSAVELYQGIQNGDFDVLIDVRTADEYSAGHIANATLMENLAVTGFPNAKPDDLAGCEHCRVAVYCRSGARAADAISHLMDAGFHVLYNGGGVNQWTAAGYPLVTGSDSVVPRCTVSGPCAVNPNQLEPPITSPVELPVEETDAKGNLEGASSHGKQLWNVKAALLVLALGLGLL